MALRNPPPAAPVRTFPSPKITDQVLVEWVNNELGDYTPIEAGAPHPNQREFSGFFLGIQRQNPSDHNFIQRVWVTPETSSDAFNYALKFSAEDDSFPVFIRTYRELKSTYTPRAKQSTLGALYKLVLDNAGSGYANGALPAVVFGNQVPAPDSIAIGHGVVNPDGSLAECVLDFGGEGYTENVTFTVEDPIDGTPASGTAYIQPTTAILVKEEANLYPQDSEFYAQYLQVVRVYETLPGPTLSSTRLDVDGVTITTSKTRGLCAEINTSEVIDSGFWIKTTKESTDIDFVCEQIQEVRAVPGNPIPSANVSEDEEIAVSTKKLRDESIITPDVVNTSGLTIVTTEKEAVSDLVSYEVITTKDELDRAVFSVRIPESIIPLEFRAAIPTVTEVHIVGGTASMPTLSSGEFFREERQYKKLLKQVTVENLGGLSFPIEQTGTETSSEYGGAVLDIVRTLDNTLLTADEGEDIVASNVNPIGDNLMWFKETKKRPAGDAEWPVLPNRLWDENMRVEYDETTQWVVTGTSEDSDPGGNYGFVSEVKAKDKWHAQIINTSKPTPDYTDESNALITYDYKPFKFPGLLYYVLTGNPGGYIRRASAQLCRHTIRTWWVKQTDPPDITVDEIFVDQIIINQLNNAFAYEYADDVLHDDIVDFGIFSYPATVPSLTDYLASWIGNEKIIAASVVPEREKDVWKVQTRLVVMR